MSKNSKKKSNFFQNVIKNAIDNTNQQNIPKVSLFKLITTFFLLFVLLITFLTSSYVVKENEYKVIRKFGEVVRIVDTPGLKFKIPFIESSSTIPKNQMIYDIETEEVTTKDKKRILIDNYVVWKVTNPKMLINNAGTLVNAESRMEEFIYSVIRSELGSLEYEKIISDEESSRGSINDIVTEKVNKLLVNNNYGIELIDVRIKRTDLPTDNEQSVYNRMISERATIAQNYLSEGDAEKTRIIAEGQEESAETLSNAKLEADKIVAEGERLAAQIYNQSYSKDKEFYELYRTLESYKTTLGEETVLMLPIDSPYAKYLTGSK